MSEFDLHKYDLYSTEFKKNVHATYDQMRAECPVRHHQGFQVPIWFVTGYELGKQILGDHKRFASNYLTALTDEERAELPPPSPLEEFMGLSMIAADKPAHTRLRGIIGKAFTAKRINGLAPRIQQIADDLIDQFVDAGTVELVDAFSFPLPIIVISELLGIPIADRDKFRDWSNAVIQHNMTQEESMQKQMAFAQYTMALMIDRRQNPQDDLISALVQVEEGGSKLSDPEILSTIMLLIVAGHETTVSLIGNALLALFEHPAELQKLLDNPDLIESAIEACLRYDGAVERAPTRIATEDVEIGGQLIKRKDPVIVVLSAANRDPAHYSNPKQFKIDAPSGQHMGFGYGIHYCLGAPLARLEAKIALSTLLKRLPNLELATTVDALEYRPSTVVRGVEVMPVKWTADA